MALIPLPINPPPGVVLTESDHAIEGRWKGALNIRFVKSKPQKLGGNVVATVDATADPARAVHAWRDNDQNGYYAAGTSRKLYIYNSDWELSDITPIAESGTLGVDPLAVTNGSNVVTVTDAGHLRAVGDTITIAGATAIGGITPNGTFLVETVVNSSHYTYLFTSNATSTVAAGGGAAVTFSYEISVGSETGAIGLGWGVGGWGLGTWGTERESTSSGSVNTVIEPRVWSLDHFGELLIASYNGGSIYYFDPTQNQPFSTRALIVSADPGLPDNCRYVFVTPERFVMALLEDMQIAWASQNTIDDWTPTAINTANIRTLTEGTKLVAGRVLADFISLIWTDAALYRLQYTGSSYIYNSSMIAKDCGLISPGGAVTAGGIAYWIGQDTFWMYNGSVQPMPNVEDIRKFVFDTIRIEFGYQCTALYQPQYNEVWFFYTINGEENPTLGVIYSIDNQCWAPLDFGRTAGAHFTQGDTRPFLAHSDGLIYQHEVGFDDNGAAMPWSLTLAPYALNSGGAHMDIMFVIPDFKDQVGDITMTIETKDYLNDSALEDTETEIVAATDSGAIDFRVSGRYVGLVLGATAAGCYMRLGVIVAWIKPSGTR